MTTRVRRSQYIIGAPAYGVSVASDGSVVVGVPGSRVRPLLRFTREEAREVAYAVSELGGLVWTPGHPEQGQEAQRSFTVGRFRIWSESAAYTTDVDGLRWPGDVTIESPGGARWLVKSADRALLVRAIESLLATG